MSEEARNRLKERRIMLAMWVPVVAAIVTVSVGFGGGIEQVFTADNPIWLLALSPAIPLTLWVKAEIEARRS